MKTFIDLFAGIGGTRSAFENIGAECVFSSEWDRFAQQTYATNFGETPFGDIQKLMRRTSPTTMYCWPVSLANPSRLQVFQRRIVWVTLMALMTINKAICSSI